MFKNPSFLFDIVCTVVWLLLAVRYARTVSYTHLTLPTTERV